MVLAGCLLEENKEKPLKKLGVKDSKQLTQKRREFLFEKIKQQAETFEIIIIHPKEIDEKNFKAINLNEVEAIACAKIINRINKGYKKIKVIVDCPSVSIEKWKDSLKSKIKNLSNLEVVCEHKADQNHVSVSAASVLAKCIREKEMFKLKAKYGEEIGSGYTSDPSTQKFLEKHAKKYQDTGIFRKTWITWKKAYDKKNQLKLQ